MIYVDVSAAVHSRAGLGRYAGNLAAALHRLRPEEVGFFYNREPNWQPEPQFAGAVSRHVGLGYKPWRLAVWLGQLARVGFDRLLPDAVLYHATEHLLMPLRRTPTVLTVHDLIYELFPQHHKRLNRWYLKLAMPLYCRRADEIITISQSSKRDVLRCYGVPEDKITVVYEATGETFRPLPPEAREAARRRHGLSDPFIIVVGTVEPRKNLVRLLDALVLVTRMGVSCQLAIVGKLGWLYEPFIRHLESVPSVDCRLLGYVPDEELCALYGAAALAVLPSLYEGFGLPVLEAMACGTPVACSSTSSLPEIAADAAVYFDPLEVEDIARVIHGVLTQEELRASLRDRGLDRAARFSWSTAARETMAVYDRLTSRPRQHAPRAAAVNT
jgi:glycosyltransferase involved in cell wall biosynthesis